jgi:hypothetical protein
MKEEKLSYEEALTLLMQEHIAGKSLITMNTQPNTSSVHVAKSPKDKERLDFEKQRLEIRNRYDAERNADNLKTEQEITKERLKRKRNNPYGRAKVDWGNSTGVPDFYER